MRSLIFFLIFTIINPITHAATTNDYLSLWEEEKLARDVYTYLYNKYETRVFGNIKSSEDRHMNMVGDLIKSNGGTVPDYGDNFGFFSLPRYKELYKALTEKGEASYKDALHVGLSIEELDIKDIEELILKAGSEKELNVLEQLKEASLRHKAAFLRNM